MGQMPVAEAGRGLSVASLMESASCLRTDRGAKVSRSRVGTDVMIDLRVDDALCFICTSPGNKDIRQELPVNHTSVTDEGGFCPQQVKVIHITSPCQSARPITAPPVLYMGIIQSQRESTETEVGLSQTKMKYQPGAQSWHRIKPFCDSLVRD